MTTQKSDFSLSQASNASSAPGAPVDPKTLGDTSVPSVGLRCNDNSCAVSTVTHASDPVQTNGEAPAETGSASGAGQGASVDAPDVSQTCAAPLDPRPAGFEVGTDSHCESHVHHTLHTAKKLKPSHVVGLGFVGGLCATVLLVSAGHLAASALGFHSGLGASGAASAGTQGTSINVQGDSITLPEAVAQKCLPSIVGIDVFGKTEDARGRVSQQLTQISLGTGVVLDGQGYIITNNHVVEGGSEFSVTTFDGKKHQAQVVGSDPSSDIAVLKIDPKDAQLNPIELGETKDLKVGQWVMTLGSPFGLEQSVATGIVSATSRSTVIEDKRTGNQSYYANLIQTDAAINPGNSGGAMVDAKGRLIGINTIISSTSGQYSGVGFAIPIDYANQIAKDLIAGKKPSHAQLGVVGTTVGVGETKGQPDGVMVVRLIEGGAAAAAGIKPGDVITQINNKPIDSITDLVLATRSYNPHDRVTVTYLRDGKEHQVEVELGADTQN